MRGIRNPPRVFEDGPEWSLQTALNPTEPVTLLGLLLYSRMDGNLWQVDQMFVAARAAADVALIHRPFAESLDAFTRAVASDIGGWIRFIREEFTSHREA